jgi:imidazolonepropionase-like amidohydrolase
LTAEDPPLPNATIVVEAGKITALGQHVKVPSGTEILNATGKFITPGLINPHSHTGLYPLLGITQGVDISESEGDIHADLHSADAINLDDFEIPRAVSGGVTTIQVLPGSDNNIGGFTTILRLNGAQSIDDAQFPNGPLSMKWAWGENPKSGSNGHPSTLMGEASLVRQRLYDAERYTAQWKQWEDGGRKGIPPRRDLQLEGLAQVLAGKVRIHVHAYQINHFEELFAIADEFHFQIAAVHHALEAYKIAPEFARRHIGVVTFADYWGYKEEAWDAVPQNAYLLWKSGVTVSMHTDSPVMEDRDYRLQGSILRHYGMPKDVALAMLTINAAKILGIDDRVGSLKVGKDADLVVWSGEPLDLDSRAEQVYIAGKLVYTVQDGFLPWKGRSRTVLP